MVVARQADHFHEIDIFRFEDDRMSLGAEIVGACFNQLLSPAKDHLNRRHDKSILP